MENSTKPVYVKIIKTCPGNLVVTITNPFTRISQRLEFDSAQNEQILPLEWAAFVYADSASGAYKMYKDGYFTFDNPDTVKKAAEDGGVLIGNVDFTPTSSTYTKDILLALTKCDKAAIDGYIKNPKGANDVVRIANEHQAELTKATIDYLEKQLHVSLTVADETSGTAK